MESKVWRTSVGGGGGGGGGRLGFRREERLPRSSAAFHVASPRREGPRREGGGVDFSSGNLADKDSVLYCLGE